MPYYINTASIDNIQNEQNKQKFLNRFFLKQTVDARVSQIKLSYSSCCNCSLSDYNTDNDANQNQTVMQPSNKTLIWLLCKQVFYFYILQMQYIKFRHIFYERVRLVFDVLKHSNWEINYTFGLTKANITKNLVWVIIASY